MKRLTALLLALLLPWPVLAQTRQPAQITTLPTVTPQSLFWLDSVGAWQPLSVFKFPVNLGAGWTTNANAAALGTTSVLPPYGYYGAGLSIGYPQTTTGLAQGINVWTSSGNNPYDDGGTSSYHVWNYIKANIDSYWSTPGKAAFSDGLFLDVRVNQSANATPPNGSVNGLQVRTNIYNPTDPSEYASTSSHTYTGAQLDANIEKGDGGADTTLDFTAASGATTLSVHDVTGFQFGDHCQLFLDPDPGSTIPKVQVVVVSAAPVGNVLTINTPLARQASAGNKIYIARGNVFGMDTVASVSRFNLGTGGAVPSKDVLLVTNQENDIIVPAGSSVLYKTMIALSPGPGDAVQGSIIDAAISIASQSNTGKITDAILFHGVNGYWPILATGGLIKVDGHGLNPQTMGYGIDMSWATIAAPGVNNTGVAFGFSTTGNGVPDNYWLGSSGILNTTGGLVVKGGPAVGVDLNASTTTVAMRMGNNQAVIARNAANSANMQLLQLNTSNTVVLGNATGSAVQVLGVPTSAGTGGLTLCIDTNGVLYKKAACP